jgi:large conductance mechanosensitive channel
MGFLKDFKKFLKEYNVLSVAVAFITGLAVNDLVHSIVDDLIMPIITPFVPQGGWEEATLALGPVIIRWGSFVSSLIYFLIIMLVVFLFINSMKKLERKPKKRKHK